MAHLKTAAMSPYTYRPGNTILHRLPGSIKLLGLLLISVAAFFSLPGILVSAIIVLVGAYSAGIRPWELLRGCRSLLLMAIFVILFRSIRFTPLALNLPGFGEGLLFGLGILLAFSAGALLFSVTTMTELKDSLDVIERKVKRTGPCRLSLGISLMLGFLPRFFEVWEAANLACQARAGKNGIPRIILLIPLVTERMIEMAAETADALESRGVSLS
ncbi:MAG: energy-coupling factor transporter transmembrane protein EcfT [Treponema sp.]|jgi:biotin transport system permease protein|nr:energy-coupling factor transporter transmembrane protein EcfT [Treponema sp.]